MRKTTGDMDDKRLLKGVLYLNTRVLGLSLGLLCGLVIFIVTNWLVIKGGDPVGPHLNLLNQYMIGYHVSFPGSFVGFLYGFFIGAAGGMMIGLIYNKIAKIRGNQPRSTS